MDVFDTIAALASARGQAAIAVIRASGPGALDKARHIIRFRDNRTRGARRLWNADVVDPTDGLTVDEVMLSFFRAPSSFTGEDALEIMCHGGEFVSQKILSLLYAAGFRAAEPGEFTRRAFLNGKIDLTTAEGIKKLTEAS